MATVEWPTPISMSAHWSRSTDVSDLGQCIPKRTSDFVSIHIDLSLSSVSRRLR